MALAFERYIRIDHTLFSYVFFSLSSLVFSLLSFSNSPFTDAIVVVDVDAIALLRQCFDFISYLHFSQFHCGAHVRIRWILSLY